MLGYITFCFSLVFMKLSVAESPVRKAASGFVPQENEPSTNQTRVISIKDIYYDYLIFLFFKIFMIIFVLPQQGDLTTDVILIKDEDDIEGCGAVMGENMHIFDFECSIKGYFT